MDKLKLVFITISTALLTVLIFVFISQIPSFSKLSPKAFIVQSGSMEPAIKAGSVVFIAKQASYNSGEIITFTHNGNLKDLVTHRIYYKNNSKNEYLTSGDANEDFDQTKVKDEQIVGKVVFSIPYLGYVANYAKKPMGFIFLVVIPATLIVYEELKKIKSELGVRLPRKISKAFLAIPVVGISIIFISVTGAFFSDSEKTQDNVFSASAPSLTPSPTPAGIPTSTPSPTATPTPGPGDVVINEIMWMGSKVSSADEWIELRNMTSNIIDLSNWVVDNLGPGINNNIVIPSGKNIIPSGFFLISNDPKGTSIINVDPDFQTASVQLTNDGEQLILKNNLGTTIDTANINDDWFEGDLGTGLNTRKSMERNSTPSDGTIAGSWHTATTQANLDPTASESATPRAANGPP